MATRYTPPITQEVNNDASGVASGWKLHFFVDPGVSVRKDTFSDSLLTSANANPVVADGFGRWGPIFLESGTYRVVLDDSDDVEIWDEPGYAGGIGSSGAVDVKTGAYTVTIDDATKIIAVDASSGAVTITLLAAATAGDGFEITVKKTDSSVNAVTVDGNAAETIDGIATFVLPNGDNSVKLRSDGSNWLVAAADPGLTFKDTVEPGLDSTGSSNAYLVAANRTISAYYDGLRQTFHASFANTGVATLNVDSVGAKTIKKNHDDDLVSGDIEANQIVDVIYSATDDTWQMQSHVSGPLLLSGIAGLVPSIGTDTNHDIDISVGECRDGSNAVDMVLSSALTKQIDAAWAVGSAAGGLDGTESVGGTPDASTWYHLWLIKRSDTGVVDALYSESATAPTLPTNYDFKRRIGAVLTNGSANIIAFVAMELSGGGLKFDWAVAINDYSQANPGTSAITQAMSSPLGLEIRVNTSVIVQDDNSGGNNNFGLITSLDITDTTPAQTLNNFVCHIAVDSGATLTSTPITVRTDTSSQIRAHLSISDAGITLILTTHGWTDDRR